jgi:RNA polymerase sigma-70 factor (ECF subfamily)
MVRKQHDARASDTESDVAALVEQAREGNRAAFEQLVGLFQGDIFRMVYYRMRSSMDAEDVTQEVFIQAYKNLPRLKSAERFRSWLFKIALNRVRDFARKKKFRAFFSTLDNSDRAAPSYEETRDQPQALDNLMARDFWKQIGLFLDKLSRMEREVFMLRFMDYLSIKEISQALGKNESTVKTHLYRSVAKFKREDAMRQLLGEVRA